MSNIPVVPDTDRRSTATLSASVGPVTVGFSVYGGKDDLSVFVDGELIAAADWELTSNSGLNVLTDVLPANDGRVTFDSVQTGDVEIIGEIKPKRISQFTVGVGIPAESHNLILSTVIACLREVYSWSKAAIRLNPGERAVKLPNAAARADKLLSFDSNGDVEATVDKTGITGPQGPTGDKGFIGRHFTFDSSTSDSDPGAGNFRLNHATLASVTGGFFDNVDINGASVTGWLDMFDDNNDTNRRGIIEIIDVSDETNWAIYLVTGTVVDGTGYRKLTLAYRASNGTLAGECTVVFYPSSDKGADGSGTMGGNVGADDNVVPRANGTDTFTLQAGLFANDDNGNIYPVTSDVGALGTATRMWADAFFASGGVLNWNNGNYTITHSAGLLTFAGGPVQLPSIELGHASDTTITRSAAGVIAVEGVDLYPQIPQNSQSAAYTAVIGDANKHILHPTADNNARTFTIPANGSVAYPIGTTLTFINEINTVTIAITTDTLKLAGTGSTGSRTLAANGIATAIKTASTTWWISGTGLT